MHLQIISRNSKFNSSESFCAISKSSEPVIKLRGHMISGHLFSSTYSLSGPFLHIESLFDMTFNDCHNLFYMKALLRNVSNLIS